MQDSPLISCSSNYPCLQWEKHLQGNKLCDYCVYLQICKRRNKHGSTAKSPALRRSPQKLYKHLGLLQLKSVKRVINYRESEGRPFLYLLDFSASQNLKRFKTIYFPYKYLYDCAILYVNFWQFFNDIYLYDYENCCINYLYTHNIILKKNLWFLPCAWNVACL